MNKKKVVISAINIVDGGPLSVLSDLLNCVNGNNFNDFEFIVLVNDISVFSKVDFNKLIFKQFPLAKKNYIFRLYFEYIYFYFFSRKFSVNYWLSFHDMSPILPKNVVQFVYCHNPSVANNFSVVDFFSQPKQQAFNLFYKYVYWINIYSNKFVIVQQFWIKDLFVKLFKIDSSKILVSSPSLTEKILHYDVINLSEKFVIFYPSFPRTFKNFELIFALAKRFYDSGYSNVEFYLTIKQDDNRYIKRLVSDYGVNNIIFLGRLNRREVYSYYNFSNCLIFPSKLETWGMPLSEYKSFDKPIFVADLPYAHETIGNYNKVKFIDPNSPDLFFNEIIKYISDSVSYCFDEAKAPNSNQLKLNGWHSLMRYVLEV